MKNQFGKDYPNERTISLWFMRLILSQYKSKNCFQNVTIVVTGAKIVIPKERIYSIIRKFIFLQKSYTKHKSLIGISNQALAYIDS